MSVSYGFHILLLNRKKQNQGPSLVQVSHTSNINQLGIHNYVWQNQTLVQCNPWKVLCRYYENMNENAHSRVTEFVGCNLCKKYLCYMQH